MNEIVEKEGLAIYTVEYVFSPIEFPASPAGDEQVLEARRAVLHRRHLGEYGHPLRRLLHGGGALLLAASGRARHGAVHERPRQIQEEHVAHGQG